METSRELKRLTLSHPHIEVITHGFLVTEVEALLFNTQLHARLLDGKATEETVLSRVLLFRAGERCTPKNRPRFAPLQDESHPGVATLRARVGQHARLFKLQGTSTAEERQRMVNEDGLSRAEHLQLGMRSARTILEKNRAGVFCAHGIVTEEDVGRFLAGGV